MLDPDEQDILRQWNADHPDDVQYNPATGKIVRGAIQSPPPQSGSDDGGDGGDGSTGEIGSAASSSSSRMSVSTSSDSGSTTTTVTPTIDPGTLAQQYGFTMSLLNAYPELRDLFNQAVGGQWTADKFQAELRNTNWYQTMSDTQRKAIIQQYSDPAAYGQLWNHTQVHVRQLMAQMGANPDDWNVINAVAGKVIMEGWADEQAADYIGQYIVFGSNGLAGGKAGEDQQQLNTYAYQMGVRNSDSWIQNATRDIVRGHGSIEQYKNQILDQSIAAFPQWEQQMRAGMTLQDLAQPYTQSMSQILELPPGQINLFDPTIRGALSYKDPSTGQAGAKPIWQFQNDLRQDPRWNKTQNAQDAAMGTAHKVLQDFGAAF